MIASAPLPSSADRPAPTWLLDRVRRWIVDRLAEGVDCPACGQTARAYRRRLHAKMAAALLRLYRAGGLSLVATSTLWPHHEATDAAKLRYWGLIEAGPDPSTWRVTELGRRWIAGDVTVPSHATIYNGECLRLDGSPLSLAEALGADFDAAELLAERARLDGPTPGLDPARLFDLP